MTDVVSTVETVRAGSRRGGADLFPGAARTTYDRPMSHRTFGLLLAGFMVCCHPSRPVTYTSDAIVGATCAAVAGAKAIGTTPTKMVIGVDAEIAVTTGGLAGRNVTPVAGKAEGQSAHTARIEMEIDPATVHCEAIKPAPRMWLDSDTGELSLTPR